MAVKAVRQEGTGCRCLRKRPEEPAIRATLEDIKQA